MGACVIGGCCGTTPEHIRAMRKRCENAELVPVTEKEFTVVSSYGQSVILGEGSKIIGVDTLCACMGEALLLHKALQKKAEGKTIEEVAKWTEENKLHICHNVTVDDLNHLHRGGRVSKTTAVLGTLVQIKPIIHMDNEGKLQVIGKERGRKKSLNKIVDMAVKQSEGWENDLIMITHGDCIEDAEYVAQLVREKMGVENILINNIGTVIGSHTGPGVVAVFCMGNER